MKKILIIGNDVDTMSLIKSCLEKNVIRSFTSRKDDVQRLLNTFTPDLVVVDAIHTVVLEIVKAYERTKLYGSYDNRIYPEG